MQHKRIYLSPPHVGEAERALLLDAFDSNWIAPLGPHVDAFEQEFARFAEVGHAVALSSGTAALHLGLHTLGVKTGDEILTSTLTFAATVNAITYLGATPTFVDVCSDSWTMDPTLVQEELSSREPDALPAAVLAVDLYGQCADYDRLAEVCAAHGVPLVSDSAEACGASYKGRIAGSMGQWAAFSFNGNKIMTTSGGGMLVSHDAATIDRVRYLASQARHPAAHYQHLEVGYNYRLSNLLAAIGRAQLRSLPDKILRRREINRVYRSALRDLRGVSFMPEASYGQSNCWLTCILIDAVETGVDTNQVRSTLEGHNIESRPVWKPMHQQPVFSAFPIRGGAVAERLFAQGLCLPSGSSLLPHEQERVIEVFRSALANPYP
jgi:dTDP-4-amino-4,6-dideoxygalactose transaminase